MPRHQLVTVREPPSLAIHRCDTNTGALLAVQGDIDPDTAPELRSALRRCLRDGNSTMDVDLSGVGCCDSSGLHVFLDTSRDAAEAGGRLRLHRPNPIVARLLTLTKTGTLLFGLPTHPPPATAVAATTEQPVLPPTARSDPSAANRVPIGGADSVTGAVVRSRRGR